MITADAAVTTVVPLPAFSDNYLWLIAHGTAAIVVDPGDGTVVERALQDRGLTLAAILITHHHPDHVGGLAQLRKQFDGPVYGPRGEADKIVGLSDLLDDGDRVPLPAFDLDFTVLEVPGHTLGHIAYFSEGRNGRPPWLFCGDTLFASGCGRLFEGTAQQMHASLGRLKDLPADTTVFCAHEYTLANLDFAHAVEPANGAIAAEIDRIQALRKAGSPSVPSRIDRERALNPFLRCADPAVIHAAEQRAGQLLNDEVAVFATLRHWKDNHVAVLR